MKKFALFCAQFCKSLFALSRVLLLYILIKILFKNFVYKQHRRSMEEGSPPPNRNASNDNFVTKTAILSSISFSWIVFTLTRDRKDLFVFFLALHLFFEKNSAVQTVKSVLVFLFWSSLYKLWIAFPNPKLVSNKISPPPQSKLLSRTVKTFFLGVRV